MVASWLYSEEIDIWRENYAVVPESVFMHFDDEVLLVLVSSTYNERSTQGLNGW